MKFVAIGTGVSWLVMATEGITSSAGFVQYGALGLLAFVIVWLLTMGFPALMKEQQADRKLFRESVEDLKTEIKLLSGKIDNCGK